MSGICRLAVQLGLAVGSPLRLDYCWHKVIVTNGVDDEVLSLSIRKIPIEDDIANFVLTAAAIIAATVRRHDALSKRVAFPAPPGLLLLRSAQLGG